MGNQQDTETPPEKATTTLGVLRRPKSPIWERHPALTGGVVAIAAAVLSAVIGFFGASVGATTSLQVAEMQNEAEDLRRSQDQRDVVYKEYLNAANNYFHAWNALASAPEPVPTDTLMALVPRFMTARTEYQAQTNEIYVYGSDTAWSAHREIARTVPTSAAGALLPDLSEITDTKAFSAAYKEFLKIRCREVTALTRSSCPQG